MKFYISAGHGGDDPGAIGNGFREADLALELRDLVTFKLTQKGHSVINDGVKGVNGVLSYALSLLGRYPTQVEIHFNASTNSTAQGTECISLDKDKSLAKALSKAISDVLGTRIRGDEGHIDQSQSARGRLAFVNKGGIIVEVCFITNSTEIEAYQAKKWLVASAIADSLIKGAL